ncbi:tetratricopeptide repeat protein [Kitasatospora sp. NBC_01250]|uniref:tetratricopeptide repeat protein n=1 Tax=unclassified Kitasatospora TaxID=2633591 RepID=UPI002E13C5E6|nr:MULTISPECIES: tetratricopeptide repeat protein [unclassified Kitasatospora]WSJ64942.1 tetratricopeptide repeat protein [Kitasatospora sp. NBC_01302]
MTPRPAPRSRWRRATLAAAASTVLGAGLFLAGGLGLAPADTSGAPVDAGTGRAGSRSGDTLTGEIGAMQERLRAAPDDAQALATLGMDYVQQAKATADPAYYPKAEDALHRSLTVQGEDNFTAMGGMAALEAGRHHFREALDWSRKAIDVNPYNATLYGTLADAYTQLGQYPEAAQAVQHMVDLRPGTPSLSRASYVAELRGDTATAREDMRRALQDAGAPADQAFARYYLGEIESNSGDPAAALAQARAGLTTAPGQAALLQAKARAEAALGDTEAAVNDYRQAVQRVPQPDYVLQLGELYQSLGRSQEAEEQYRVFRAEEKLLTDNGVTLDSDAALFEADHGNPEQALTLARQALLSRPFLETHDALAWALHACGRDREALAEADQALTLGTRNALFHYHRGVIEKALGASAEARTDLGRALAINPHFSPLHAPKATAALAEPAPADGRAH